MRAECIRTIEELALSDPRVVVVASDPSPPFMPELAAKHPERLLIEGVCEQALVGMSAGLASEGFYPFIIMLAVFGSRRCYEQLLLDFGLHEFSGCMVGAGGGLFYAPMGPTHIAVDDMLLFSAIPGAAILTPGEPNEAIALTKHARSFRGLSYMRLAGTTDPLPNAHGEIKLGQGRLFAEPTPESVLFISCAAATFAVQSAVSILKDEGIQAGALHLHTVKPLDVDLIRRCAANAAAVVCVEEHRQIGGLASSVLQALTSAETPTLPTRFASIGVDDTFPAGHGTYENLLEHYGIAGGALADRAKTLLRGRAN
jgi:transketolase